MLRIVHYPHPALRFESVPVLSIDNTLRTQVRAMFDLMYENRGIGLAANQVALPFRFFVLNVTADPNRPEEERVFINPEIVKRHASTIEEEGCLSFPGLYGDVPRAKKIRVRGYDLQGREIDLEADELLGRAIQHEIDHVAGKLFIDYFTPEVLRTAAPKIREFETKFRAEQSAGAVPKDTEINKELRRLAGLGA